MSSILVRIFAYTFLIPTYLIFKALFDISDTLMRNIEELDKYLYGKFISKK